jgi:hypothetical protein
LTGSAAAERAHRPEINLRDFRMIKQSCPESGHGLSHLSGKMNQVPFKMIAPRSATDIQSQNECTHARPFTVYPNPVLEAATSFLEPFYLAKSSSLNISTKVNCPASPHLQ